MESEGVVFYDRFSPILIQLNKREKDLQNSLTLCSYIEETENDGEFREIKNPDETREEYEEKASILKQKYPRLVFADKGSFQIKHDTYNYIMDVLEIDDVFMIQGYGFKDLTNYDILCSVLCDSKDEYLGHVWIYTSKLFPQFCGIYGMKSSIINIINRENKDVATKLLLNGVIPYAKTKGCNEIVVPWPLPPMVKLLERLGFKEFNTQHLTDERRFLEDVSSTSNYFVLNI